MSTPRIEFSDESMLDGLLTILSELRNYTFEWHVSQRSFKTDLLVGVYDSFDDESGCLRVSVADEFGEPTDQIVLVDPEDLIKVVYL